MAHITLTEASRITGAARRTLYHAMQEGRLTREPDGTGDTAELLRAGFALQRAPSATTLHDDATIRDVTPANGGEDAPAVLSLARLVAALERELEAAKAREAPLLEQGRPPQGFWARMVASWHRPSSSEPTQP